VEEQSILEDVLHRRWIEAWRMETAKEAKKAAKAMQTGKLRSQQPKDVIAALRSGLKNG
jgi:hypothetical protein